MCKIGFVSFTNEENNAFDTASISEIGKLQIYLLVGHPEPEKKNSVGIFEYILASMLKVYLDVF